MNEYRQMAIKALENQKGDDLYRAKRAFGSLSENDLDKEYGQSGESCRSILNGYIERDNKINKAIEWLKSI